MIRNGLLKLDRRLDMLAISGILKRLSSLMDEYRERAQLNRWVGVAINVTVIHDPQAWSYTYDTWYIPFNAEMDALLEFIYAYLKTYNKLDSNTQIPTFKQMRQERFNASKKRAEETLKQHAAKAGHGMNQR